MIVEKTWTTRSKRGEWNRYSFEGRFFHSIERTWTGWFLFGIIPVFVKNVRNFYIG